jgi:pimeloyl-CoA dehydrogenase small subunit
MDFDLSPEQQQIADNLARLMKDKYGFEARKGYAAQPHGYAPDLWRQYADLGLLGAPFSEEDGGYGGGAVETMLTQEAFGRALALEPYLGTVVLAGGALRHGATPEQRAGLIAEIASGEKILALAHAEPQSGWNPHDVKTTARAADGGFVLDGEKGLVLNGDSATRLIVLARVSGGQRDTQGLGFFLVEADAAGVSRRGYPTQDGRRAAEITLSGVKAKALGAPGEAGPAMTRVIEDAIAALCAEAVGAMAEAVAMTTEHLKTRKQFGIAIGSFQALQHRASDMVVALEQARSMMYLAAMSTSETDAAARAQSISAAKAQIGRSAKFIGQQATQLHGGIAMTWEYKLGHLFKRLTMIDMAYGDADYHLAKLAGGESLFD